MADGATEIALVYSLVGKRHILFIPSRERSRWATVERLRMLTAEGNESVP